MFTRKPEEYEQEEELEEGPVWSVDVIHLLTDLGSLRMIVKSYPFTKKLNAHLSTLTDATPLVPVFTNDTLEDIVKWSENIDVKELSNYVKEGFSHIGDSIVVGRSIKEICSPDYVGTFAGEHVKRSLSDEKELLGRRTAVRFVHDSFQRVRPDSTKEDFYVFIDELGMVDGLLKHRDCPLNWVIKAVRRAAIICCMNADENRSTLKSPYGADITIVCVALVTAMHMYEDIDKGRAVFLSVTKPPGRNTGMYDFSLGNYNLPLCILKFYHTIKSSLAEAFHNEIRLSLMMLEEVFDLDILGFLRDNTRQSSEHVMRAAHLLLD